MVAGLLGLQACAFADPKPAREGYVPNRRDYAAFRAGAPEVLDPNYLPFMAHRISQTGGRDDLLIFCRWDEAEMPLAVYIAPAQIDESLQDEFDPRDPALYVDGVARALDTWESHLESLVRFRRVERPEDAQLRIALIGERAPTPEEDVKVLGTTRVGDACRAKGWDPDADRLRVEFRVPEFRIYVADEFGLLSDQQVEWVALHEIGHALGMRFHSPIPGDLMYEIVRDRLQIAEGLSIEDVNSFVSLYRLPNGSVFGRVRPGAGGEAPEALPPTGPPMLTVAPYVDGRLGFSLKLPQGWLPVETPRGMFAVDGLTWDYTASFQIVMHRYPTIEAYLARYGAYYATRGRLVYSEEMVVNGRRAVRGLVARPGNVAEEITLIESGDGRLVAVTADCPTQHFGAYGPWFEAALSTLDIWDFGPRR